MQQIIESLFEKEQLILSKFKKQKIISRDIKLSDFKLQWFVWLRWVWKTTFLLQNRIQTPNSIYISCDDLILKNVNFFDLIKELYKAYKIDTFFLDELQFLGNWQQILKNIYDFLDVKVVFSGSSMMKITSWSVDLSRRVLLQTIYPFSFWEFEKYYWNDLPKISFDEVLQNFYEISKKFSATVSLLRFIDFLKHWQFWYWFEVEDEKIFYDLLLNSIRKSIYEDLSHFVDIQSSNLAKLEKILLYLVSLWVSQVSINSLAKKVWINNKTCQLYLDYLEKLWWIIQVPKYGRISDSLRKEKKFYFSNTNILYALKVSAIKEDIFRWNVRESFFISSLSRLKEKYWFEIYFKSRTDFVVVYKWKVYEFEVWWKSKKRKDVFVIKDDILIWGENTIPLWIWGLVF